MIDLQVVKGRYHGSSLDTPFRHYYYLYPLYTEVEVTVFCFSGSSSHFIVIDKEHPMLKELKKKLKQVRALSTISRCSQRK